MSKDHTPQKGTKKGAPLPPASDDGMQAHAILMGMSDETEEARTAAKLEEEAERIPPILPRGRSGDKYVYYSRLYKAEHRYKPSEHTKMNIIAMAPLSTILSYFKIDGELPLARALGDIAAKLLDMSGRAGAYDPRTTRGAGVWNTKEGVIYNAGNACFLCTADGTLTRCLNIRMRGKAPAIVYEERAACPHPAAEPLTDEEGQALRRLFQARAWAQPYGADIMTGWLACAILGEALPFRPHVWVTAPTNTGKTQLKTDICDLLHGMAVCLESAKATEASCRQYLNKGTFPVIMDEADPRSGNAKQAGNVMDIMELARSATTGGIISKGSLDGTPREYYIASAFLFFSIRSTLSKDEDLNRFAALDMSPLPPGKELQDLCTRYEAARLEVTAPGYRERLLTRILMNVSRLKSYAAELTAHLRKQGIAARRAEHIAHIMAGQWVLLHTDAMTDEYLTRAVGIARSMEAASAGDNEASLALITILGYRAATNGLTIGQLARVAYTDSPTGVMDLEGAGARITQYKGKGAATSEFYLRIDQAHPAIRKALVGTIWENSRDGIGKALKCLPGVLYEKAKVNGRVTRCIFIPKNYWFTVE